MDVGLSPVPFERRFRILSVDPGTNRMGLAVLDHDIEDDQTYVIWAKTIRREHLLREKPWIAEVHGDPEAAVFLYRETLLQQLNWWDPCAVVSEVPYMGRFPKAFQRLTEVVTAIRFAVMEWDINAKLNPVEPSAAKKNIGVKGKSGDKTLIPLAIKKRKDVHFDTLSDLDKHDEHVHDAVAVGLCYIDQCVKIIPY